MTTEETTPLDDFLPYLFRRLTTTLNTAMIRDLKPFGINVPRWRVIAILHFSGQSSIHQLTRLTALTQPGVSQVVDQLEAEKLITRKPDPDDNRLQQVSLTKAGQDIFESIFPIVIRHQDRLTTGLSDDEKKQAIRLCRKMLSNIQ